ncbi:hypothetical protein OROMI_004153 [Orobanche minor]
MPRQKAGPNANLKKIAEWVLKSPRNPESYILRDQVLMRSLITRMFPIVQFFTVVAIGVVTSQALT